MSELAEKIIKSLPNSKSKIIRLDKIDPLDGIEREILITKAKSKIGFNPLYSFEDTIRKIVAFNSKIDRNKLQ